MKDALARYELSKLESRLEICELNIKEMCERLQEINNRIEILTQMFNKHEVQMVEHKKILDEFDELKKKYMASYCSLF